MSQTIDLSNMTEIYYEKNGVVTQLTQVNYERNGVVTPVWGDTSRDWEQFTNFVPVISFDSSTHVLSIANFNVFYSILCSMGISDYENLQVGIVIKKHSRSSGARSKQYYGVTGYGICYNRVHVTKPTTQNIYISLNTSITPSSQTATVSGFYDVMSCVFPRSSAHFYYGKNNTLFHNRNYFGIRIRYDGHETKISSNSVRILNTLATTVGEGYSF